ncbi:hypothetical protein ACFW5I_26710 [Streptomyces sp. NPDC058818]|uniref:hypothetical protein n=1 Tax=Streptomyces sp. NPDC058818 TaxID=3346640 RepID=UPI0036B10F5C
MTLDEATDLLTGAAVASAYDDVLHGVGPLAHAHFPASRITSLRFDGDTLVGGE